jgi:hypothetical protein
MNMMPESSLRFALVALTSLLCGCGLQVIQPPTELIGVGIASPPEPLLLDVGIAVFTPLDEPIMDQEQAQDSLQNLRTAESRYTSWLLGQTLGKTGQWGVVHLNPFSAAGTDLTVSGAILQSDGETLRIQVTAVDASGGVWLDKQYLQVVNAEDYGAFWEDIPAFPFQP